MINFYETDEGVPEVSNLQHASLVRSLVLFFYSIDSFAEPVFSLPTQQHTPLRRSPMPCIHKLVQSLILDAATMRLSTKFGTLTMFWAQ